MGDIFYRTTDDPYSPRMRKLIAFAKAQRMLVVWRRGAGWGISAHYGLADHFGLTCFAVEGDRLRLLPCAPVNEVRGPDPTHAGDALAYALTAPLPTSER